MNKAEIQALKGAVGIRLEEQGEFKRLDVDMRSLNSELQQLENKTRVVMKKTGVRIEDFLNRSGVAFSVSMTSNTHLKADDPLIVDDVQVNLGNGFNATTGKFIVPTKRRYLISLTIRAEYRKQVSAEIVANDEVLARLTSGYTEIERASASVTVVKELRPNDKVFVRQANDKTGEYHGRGYTSFCAVLFD